REAVQAFDYNHIPSNSTISINEELKYQFASQTVATRSTRSTFTIGAGFVSSDLYLEYLNFEKVDDNYLSKLELYLKSGMIISQKLNEYGSSRSDSANTRNISIRDLDFQQYVDAFYGIERIRMVSPLFNYLYSYQKLDHFGFLSTDFAIKHSFELQGKELIEGVDCYKIKITPNKKSSSVSIGGHSSEKLYQPEGYVWIDTETLAFIRLQYQYVNEKDFFNSTANKVENNS